MGKRLIEQELPLDQLIFTLQTMLFGKEGEDWAYHETDPDWWGIRLYTRQDRRINLSLEEFRELMGIGGQ